MYHARDATTGAVLAERLRPAHTHWTRLKGLLGTRSLAPGDGLWLRPCRQVHMIGMRYAIDVLFLDDDRRVVGVISGLQPGKISPKIARATSALELPDGTLARLGVTEGAQIQIGADSEAISGARPLWLHCLGWTVGFLAATAIFVLLGRAVIPWERPCPEYVRYWAAGKILASGGSPYDLPLLAKIEREYGFDKVRDGLGYYDFIPHIYPPSVLNLILVLLVPLGFSTARMTWLVLNTELLFMTGYMLRNAVAGVPRIVPMALIPFFALSVLSVLVGQVTALIVFLMAGAWRLLQRGWDRAAGCVLACMSIKPQLSTVLLMATLVWLARQRRWQAIGAFVTFSALLFGVNTWLIPWWPLQIAQNLSAMPLATGTEIFPWWGTTWLLVLRSLGLEGGLLWALYALVAAPFCWLVLRCALQRNSGIDEVFALSLLATFFVGPTARIYDLPILLIPVLVLLDRRTPEILGAALLLVLIIVPYVHVLWWIPSRDNIPAHVWFFWIPLLLASFWFASPLMRLQTDRPCNAG